MDALDDAEGVCVADAVCVCDAVPDPLRVAVEDTVCD